MFGLNDYYYRSSPLDIFQSAGNAGSICFILAVIAGLVLLFAFLPERNEHRYKGFALWLFKIYNFRKMFSMGLIKFFYLVTSIFLTLMGFVIMFSGQFLPGLLLLTIGNLIVRIIYEFFVLAFSIHDNLSQINHNTNQLVNKPQGNSGPNQPL